MPKHIWRAWRLKEVRCWNVICHLSFVVFFLLKCLITLNCTIMILFDISYGRMDQCEFWKETLSNSPRNYLKKKLIFYRHVGRVRDINKGWWDTQQSIIAGNHNSPQPEKLAGENVVPGLWWWIRSRGNNSGVVAIKGSRQHRTVAKQGRNGE